MKRLPFFCGGQWEAVLFSPIRLLQEKVTPSPIPTFGEPGKPAPSSTLPGTRVPHAGSGQAWSPRAGQVAFTLSWPTLQGGALIAGPPSVPLSPILKQGHQSPKQVSTAHVVRRAWLVGLQFPAPALHPSTSASPQTCRRVRSERAGTHQGLSNNLVERERDRKTTGSESAAQPLSFPDKAREV